MFRTPTEYDFERPWARQPCDTDLSWRVFKAYRDLPPPRSVRKAVKQAGSSLNTATAWARNNGWAERVFAYDRHLDAIRTEVVVEVLSEDAREVANRHATIARDAADAAYSVVQGWMIKIADGEPLEGWTPGDVRAMLKDMITLERLVRGEVTERIGGSAPSIDLSQLSIDELEQLRALQDKAGMLE